MAGPASTIRARLLTLVILAGWAAGRAQQSGGEGSPAIPSTAQSGGSPEDARPQPPIAAPGQREDANRTVRAPDEERPLPDIVAMMRDVESNQRKAETVEKDYIYRSVETEVEKDGNGQTKKTTVSES